MLPKFRYAPEGDSRFPERLLGKVCNQRYVSGNPIIDRNRLVLRLSASRNPRMSYGENLEMKTPILVGICVAISLGASEAVAEQHDKSPAHLAEDKAPNSIPCAQETGEALGECTYRVERHKNGKTMVTVAFPNGFKRGLFFKDGKFLKGSMTMSGVGTDTDWSLKDGTHIIRVDDQRYEVPNTLISDN